MPMRLSWVSRASEWARSGAVLCYGRHDVSVLAQGGLGAGRHGTRVHSERTDRSRVGSTAWRLPDLRTGMNSSSQVT